MSEAAVARRPPEGAQHENLPLEDLYESPSNPRAGAGDLAELIESIREHGILQPVLVRPRDRGGFEIVCGHRRTEAAREVGMTLMPAIIRDLNDQEALEIQITENLQRADLHPLEEADAYVRLHAAFGYSADDIAVKVARSVAYVQRRMKLAGLSPKVRTLFRSNKLTPATALIVARIPDKKQADEAAEEIARREMSAQQAADHVRRTYMLLLKDAPFPQLDAGLVKTAGACNVCPKRTGAQRALFEEVSPKEDLCLDAKCHAEKVKAHGDRVLEQAKAEKKAVMPDSQAKKVFDKYQGDRPMYGSGFVSADAQEWKGGKTVKVRDLIKGTETETVFARNPHTGAVVELVPKRAVEKATGTPGSTSGNYEQDQRRKAEKKKAVAAALITAVMEKVQLESSIEQTRFIARGLVREFGADTTWAIAKRRELGIKQGEQVRAFEKFIEEADYRTLALLIVELVITSGAGASYGDGYGRNITEACKLWKVDLKAIEKRVSDELSAKRKGVKKAAPAVRATAKASPAPTKKAAPKKKAAKKSPPKPTKKATKKTSKKASKTPF